ncbi:MAG TPA: hypothetical protein VG345_08970, partial [Bryobacteraceae bacterium]|nr:hypothetical protein [Bryobacteraceae bacterium]
LLPEAEFFVRTRFIFRQRTIELKYFSTMKRAFGNPLSRIAALCLCFGGFTSPSTNFTTQFFSPDALTDQIYLTSPYNQRTSARDTYNTSDSMYTGLDCGTNSEDGSETMFNITTTSAYASASYNVILDLTGNAPTCTSTNPGGGSPLGGSPPSGGPPSGSPPPDFSPGTI